MKEYIEERTIEVAQYIIESKATVRAAAKKFGISKSTVHKDITQRLLQINAALAHEVKIVLDENKAERHIRGGMATRLKYEHNREKKEVIWTSFFVRIHKTTIFDIVYIS